MCTNAALVDSLEGYMDDLLDCFEDFVRKSLLVISVALGTIILMVMYVLKVLAERAAMPRNMNHDTEPVTESHDFQCEGITTACKQVDTQAKQLEVQKSDTTVESDTESTSDANRYKKTEPITSNYVLDSNNTTSTSAQAVSRPSFDEKVLREIGLSSCSKPCNTSKRTVVPNNTGSRCKTPCTQQMCISKHHLSDSRPCSKYIAIRTSCCSMCCVDDDRR